MKEDVKKRVVEELDGIYYELSSKKKRDIEDVSYIKQRIRSILSAHTSANDVEEEMVQKLRVLEGHIDDVDDRMVESFAKLRQKAFSYMDGEEMEQIDAPEIDEIEIFEVKRSNHYIGEKSIHGKYQQILDRLSQLTSGDIVDYRGSRVPTADLKTMQGRIKELLKEAQICAENIDDRQVRVINKIKNFVSQINVLIEEDRANKAQESEVEAQEDTKKSEVAQQSDDDPAKKKKEEALRKAVNAIEVATEVTKQQTEAIEQFTSEFVQNKKKERLAFIMNALTSNGDKTAINIPSSKGDIAGLRLSTPTDPNKGVMISTMAMASLFSKQFDNNILTFDQSGNSYYISREEIVSLSKGLKQANLGEIANYDKESLDLLKEKEHNTGKNEVLMDD